MLLHSIAFSTPLIRVLPQCLSLSTSALHLTLSIIQSSQTGSTFPTASTAQLSPCSNHFFPTGISLSPLETLNSHLSFEKRRFIGVRPWAYFFSLYISPIAEIASVHGLSQQQYADDTQLYIAVTKSNLSFNVQNLNNVSPVFRLGSALMALPLTLTSQMSSSLALGSDHALSFSDQHRCRWLHGSSLLRRKHSRCHCRQCAVSEQTRRIS